MTKCLNCNKEIEQNKNETKRFCSEACRKAYSRKADKLSYMDKSDNIKADTEYKEGYCKRCGRKVSEIDEQFTKEATPEQREYMGKLIEVCLPCSKNANTKTA